jgi:Uma2 family endonuclease
MNARTGVSVEEYLHTSFPDTDREYRDGELVERSLPDTLHASAQILIGAFFVALRLKLGLYVYTEARVKLREGLYLIPDISVFWPDKPPLVPDFPPLATIEILSKDDRQTDVRAKLEQYRTWGVAHVWLVDPYLRKLYTCDARLTEVDTLRIPELDLELRPEDIFE